jgi:hypothetical protein
MATVATIPFFSALMRAYHHRSIIDSFQRTALQESIKT